MMSFQRLIMILKYKTAAQVKLISCKTRTRKLRQKRRSYPENLKINSALSTLRHSEIQNMRMSTFHQQAIQVMLRLMREKMKY